MANGTIYKTVDEYTQQSFKAYKTWTLTESTIGQYSSSVNEAIYVSASLLTDPWGANASGFNKKSLFNTVWNMYYRYPTLPYNALGGNAQFQDRDISSRAVIVSISSKYFGEQIKPGSIRITDNSGSLILDDGYGNLYDGTDTTTYVSNDGLIDHWSFNDGFITSGNLASDFSNRNHVIGGLEASAYNVRYTDGVYGSKIYFDGSSGSFAVVENHRGMNFRTGEDFAVSLWVWLPPTQSMSPVIDNMILEKWDGNGGYPFIIRVLNHKYPTVADQGKVYCASYDTSKNPGIISTTALNDNLPHHIVYQRKGNVYEMFVDSASQGTVTADLGQSHNDSPLYIGARGYAPSPTGVQYNLTGAVDEVRIYSGSLTNAQIKTLFVSASNTNVVGNAFYSHGVLAITNLSGSRSHFMGVGSEFVMTYKSTVTITENSVLATVVPNDFNMTFNPSSAQVDDVNDMTYRSFVTGSDWSPYITTIGFYDDKLNLLAVGKFAKPIKKPTDVPITFAVRWDS